MLTTSLYEFDFTLAIDPGIEGTGLAIMAKNGNKNQLIVHDTKVIIPKADNYLMAISQILRGLDEWHYLKTWNQKNAAMLIEEPILFAGSAKSMAAGAKGDLHKLSACFGAIAAWGMANHFRLIQPIPVREWKGQMPKEAVIHRIQKRIAEGRLDCEAMLKNHEADAIGIGLYGYNEF